MAVIKTIQIDGKDVKFRASAAIPRLYRIKFGRDIFEDLNILQKATQSENGFDVFSLEMFENIAYIMAKHADDSVPDTPEEWLDEFGTFSIYEVLPELIALWGMNIENDITSKKNLAQLTDR